MKSVIPRSLLAAAAAIFGLGAVMHGLAFLSKASATIDQAQLSPFMASELKVLWLADSTTLLALTVTAGLLAAQRELTQAPALFALAVIPAATAALIYAYLGPFYAAHMLTAGSAMVATAGIVVTTRRGLRKDLAL